MKYIIALDQSTSATKAVLINETGEIVRRNALPHKQYYPLPGHVEHDAEEIYQNTLKVIHAVMDGIDSHDVAAISIANQRETTVIWERITGKPVCPAVVWQDVRGEYLTRELSSKYGDEVLKITGLKLSPYYPAAKAAAVLDQNPAMKRRAINGELLFGTIDSFLLYRLTGCLVHATDVSNASRTQLMNLHSLAWDVNLLRIFDIPESMMPRNILHSDTIFGETNIAGIPSGIPITGVMGDSHSALFGHGCHAPGTVKATYGTGSSIMLNAGEHPVYSENGLSASVGFGFKGAVSYVLEGNITSSADTLIWLRDELKLIDDINDIEQLAASVPDTQGVCLVPAFSGLGAPYFDSNARAILCGMNRGTTRAHILRAALESIAQQNADVLDCMSKESCSPIEQLKADGGGTINRLLMQMQADFVPCSLICSSEKEITAYGAGIMAGITMGLFQDFDEVQGQKNTEATYIPSMSEEKRREIRSIWASAVKRAR